MSDHTNQSVTRLLNLYNEGDKEVFNELFTLVYEHLYHMARARNNKWHGNHTLNTTAILHEAYLKLVDQSSCDWKDRSHFFAVASKAMRHILINYARDQNRQKRGGNFQKISLKRLNLAVSGEIEFSEDRNDVLIALDDALKKLSQVNKRQAKIVEYLFFGGMTINETATALNVSPSTVKRGWKTAQLWLLREIEKSDSVKS